MRFSFESDDGSLTVYDPPAIVVQAFDEEKALAECRALIGRRDAAKGEFKDAILAIGQKLIEARRAMPGVMMNIGKEKYSPKFCAFIEKLGISRRTATHYISYANDPRRLEMRRESRNRTRGNTLRRKVLQEMVAAIDNGYSLAEIKAAIQKELANVPQ